MNNILLILWCVVLVCSILMLWLPSKIIDTTCAYIHAGYVLWIVAALFGIKGKDFVGLALILVGFLLMLICLMRKRKVEI